MYKYQTSESSEFLFLPTNGIQSLCKVRPDGSVKVLTQMPSLKDALYKISTDGKFFGVLDFARKRLAVYEFTDTLLWYRKVIPPTTLPRRCIAHDFILHEGRLIVGGASHSYENIWMLNYGIPHESTLVWKSLDVPANIRKKGKSIDLLYVAGETLIAVDNVILPKWIILYSLLSNKSPEPIGLYPLRVVSAFEHIYHGAESECLYALFSKGIRHNVAISSLQIYFKDDIFSENLSSCESSEVNHGWLFRTSKHGRSSCIDDTSDDVFFNLPEPVSELPSPIVYSMEFYCDFLFIATGINGIWMVDTRPIIKSRKIDRTNKFQKIQSTKLKSVNGFSRPTKLSGKSGFFAIGLNESDVVDYEWHSSLN